MNKIITISREYGAGGRSVGLAVAKEFGTELYDRDIVRELVKESGLEYDFLSSESEKVHRWENFWRIITPMQYDQKDALFDMQKEVVLDFAKNGSCVIVGRCADVILKEAGYDCFNVFLYGNEDFRALNMQKTDPDQSLESIKKHMKKIDAERAAYYIRYTGESWGDYKNYDMLLDTSVIGFEAAAKLIVDAVKATEK